ncbi:membrane protease YdiL (CAAX protease family) [Pullulanibacillus pueri]|uniref:CAAX prenyl protease 2/Lysostaphin resistance protein A-like domain-containing protein n=1 Tax=Pullulanibacillus pueri TaxID=1437324 RepID=A0A8J2ZT34_9BACL|nr:CPBP family intramembrane glutamic endopeptidase [Pullulanibacillus pueri]MBM7681070.1 membrane protease YdiL (CAAX protease family) [Pullulanibacillus pueri]GGH76929.1 hypothetical protein GCM10007096_08070 [Pullulanibacillus pueri]
MQKKLRSIFYIRVSPSIDLLLAFLSELLVMGTYYFTTHTQNPFLQLIMSKIVLSVLFTILLPVLYMVGYKKQPLASLGIKKHLWLIALIISVIFSFIVIQLFGHGIKFTLSIFPMVIINGLNLWEPLFVYGWLQLRFENAFGAIPSIILSGLCYGFYHIGSVPIDTLFPLIGMGIIYGFLFKLSGNNLFVLFPIMWSFAEWTGITAHPSSLTSYGDIEGVIVICILLLWMAIIDRLRHRQFVTHK